MNPEDSNFPAQPEVRRAKKWRVIEGAMAGQGTGRSLPHSLEAEEYLLSCILLDPKDVLARCELIQLTPEAFYLSAHIIVFEVARDMWRKNLPVDPSTLAEELKTRRLLDQVGGYAFITQISAMLPTTAQATYFLEKVFEQGLLRAFIRDGVQAVEDAYGYSGGIDELLGKYASKLQRLADFALRRNRKAQREVAREARAYAQAAMAGQLDKTRVMPFGGLPHTTAAFLAFDVAEEDWFILLGAVRNGGKSTLARWHCGNNLVGGKIFIVFLLETSRRRWLNALAAMFAGVNLRELEETRALFPDKAKRFEDWAVWIESIMEQQLWIFDDIFYIEDIERQVREINRRVRERQFSAAIAAGKSPEEADKLAYGIDGVIGDHIHIVQTRTDFRGNRERELSYIGRILKMLGKTLNFSNFWCAQLNRGPASDERRPRISDLRDSGTLENDADCVLLLHKPVENKAGTKQTGDQETNELELIQGKRRNGPAGISTGILMHLKHGSFEEIKGAAPRPGMPKPAGGYKREGGGA